MGKFVRAGITGKDINKINRAAPNYAELKAKAPDVPESQGLVVGAVYLCFVMLCQPLLREYVCFVLSDISINVRMLIFSKTTNDDETGWFV